MHHLQAWFAGEWRDGRRWLDLPVTSTRTEAVRVAALASDQVMQAIAAANDGASRWNPEIRTARRARLRGWFQALRAQREALSQQLTTDTGGSDAHAAREVKATIEHAERMLLADSRSPGRNPLGVVCVCSSAAQPLYSAMSRLLPALWHGNQVLHVAAPAGSATAACLQTGALEAGLNTNELQLLTGEFDEVTAMLIGDAQVAAITYVGEDSRGAQLERFARARGARVQRHALDGHGKEFRAVHMPSAFFTRGASDA